MPGRPPSAPPGDHPQPSSGVPFLDSMTDGPTVRLSGMPDRDGGPPRPARARWALLACLVALLAMAGAGFAATLGWRAMDQARAARDLAARDLAARPDAATAASTVPATTGPGGAPGGTPSVPVATAAGSAPGPVVRSAGPPPADATVLIGPAPASAAAAPSPSAPGAPRWELRYADRALQVPAGCAATVHLDRDEPRIDGPGPGRCGDAAAHLRLGPGATAGAEVPGQPRPDAEGCAERLAAATLGAGAAVPVRAGGAFCVRTGRTMVLLEVTSVQDGQVSLRATAWRSGG